MHKKLISEASDSQLRDFITDALSMLKATNHDLYEELEENLYKRVYGCHFNQWLLDEALSKMVNEDGSKGGHWTLEQTSSVAKSRGIALKEYNEYDFCYVMNMIYSDYYGVVSDSVDTYINLAVRFLEDKDFRKGKAFHYYMMTKENNK